MAARTIRVEGIREARERLDDVGLRARRPEPALRHHDTLRDLTQSEERRFASRAGWRKDKPSWVAEKRRRGLDPRVMRAEGRLERALTSGHGMTFRAYNGTLYWGIPRGRSDLYYAQPLALRGRKSVRIDKEAADNIAARVQRYVAEGDL